jgi:hypothetical protein
MYVTTLSKNESFLQTVISIPLAFGAEVAVAGFVGVGLGGYLSTLLRDRFARSDPVIAGTGLFVSAPVLLTAFFLTRDHTVVAMVLVFFGMIGINLNWSIVADITLVSRKNYLGH